MPGPRVACARRGRSHAGKPFRVVRAFRRRNAFRTQPDHHGGMPTSVDTQEPATGTIRDAVGPRRIAAGTVLGVAAALSAASFVAAPASAITLAVAWLYGAVGGLLAIRRPRNPIGWLFLGILLVFTSTLAADAFGGTAVKNGAPLPDGLPLGLIWVETWAYAAMFGLYYALTLVFPSGRLPAGRVRRFATISLVVPIAAVVAGG